MPFWPFSDPTPSNNEDELPWNAAIIPCLQVKEVFRTVVILPDPEFMKYKDPAGTHYMTQFTRLKYFLDAKLLDENCRAWKELQETDPGFKKIQIIHMWFDNYRKEGGNIPNEVGPVTFPEEWKDEDFFLNWFLDTLERATHVIVETNHVKDWHRFKEEHKARLMKEQRTAEQDAQYEKDKAEFKASWEGVKQAVKDEWNAFFLERKREQAAKELEKDKKRQEEQILKEVRSERRLDKMENY
ncbi:uncharacterized protein NECHADRAFT_82077 [Fusarium vanettenii 77-13-4]|uniref:Uncharacterized protein n=1 Tax=Fusarium vanettenii (strain ATCC MYA-4622 / CBS 123669 / FGSC 9596 / NRRL 45880 / 77-13-4) TaxID=660122 RepID=C7ZAF2_FUSV7|nr:uncharacterized protein NECHADRAFT_82077 [Fusarium vanettenii 77-13-4]EEU39665.1 predicted protein [Fusarium vanettenii 77-13-4]